MPTREMIRRARPAARATVLTVASTVLAVTLAFAQEQPTAEDEGSMVPAATAPQGPALSGPEQITRGEDYLQRMQMSRRRVMGMLDEARRARDIIKATCLNDKLTQINGNLRVAEERIENLRMAIRTSDEGRRHHEFAIVSVVRQKVDSLGIEADACVGEERWYTGATRVETRVDRDIPEEDTTRYDLPPFIIERPPSASGFY